MKKSLAPITLLVLLASVVGCRRAKVTVDVPPPPQRHAQKPPVTSLAPSTNAPQLPASVSTPPNVVLGGTVAPTPRKREWRRPVGGAALDLKNAQANAAKNAAAGEEPSNTTPIGQLSAAPNTQGLPDEATIGKEIISIQKQLDGIHHAMNASEQRTATQIKTFLAKASNALQAGDLDGAHTLAVKARVLLNELH